MYKRQASGKGGRKLAVGDLAYLLTKTEGFKTKVNGPFVVCALSEWHVELRTSAQYMVNQSTSSRSTETGSLVAIL